MADGSLATSIGTLEDAVSSLVALIGHPADGATPAAGLSGAAALLDPSPVQRVESVASELGDRLPSLIHFDTATTLGNVIQAFPGLKTEAGKQPTQAVAGFQTQLDAAGGSLTGDLVGGIESALTAIRSISQAAPSNPSAVVGPLIDQLLGVSNALGGPEADKIRSWAQSLQALHRELMPLIQQAGAAQDPAAFAIQVIERSLTTALDTLGFGRAKSLVQFLETFPGGVLEQPLSDAVKTSFVAVSDAYTAARSASAAPFEELRAHVAEAGAAAAAAKDVLRPLLVAATRVTESPLLQPGALEAELRSQIERALGVQIHDVATVDDPFKDLFDRIDHAIESIDLGPVREDVLGFFDSVRQTVEEANLPALGDTLHEAIAPARDAVNEVRDGVASLQQELTGFVDGLASDAHAAAREVGSFQPDGSFRFAFEDELHSLFGEVHLAIAGDPADPSGTSVAGTLKDLQESLNGVFEELGDLLESVANAVDNAVQDAVDGVNAFVQYLESLDLPHLSEQLRDEVKQIIDALAAIDLDNVVDEVVDVLNENTAKLRGIQPSSMNELLRAALKLALEVFIAIDFTSIISDPLKAQFGELKKVPANAIADLQSRYEAAIGQLDALHPEQLLSALFDAFDKVTSAVGALRLATLLAPLDDLHTQYIETPLSRLEPMALLAPVSRAFHDYTSALDRLNGQQLVSPVEQQLDALKASAAAVDPDAAIDGLLNAVDKAKADLAALKPSELIAPLTSEVQRLLDSLDALKPSTLLAPAAELAGPLLTQLETVQQQAVDSLYGLFQRPLGMLDKLEPAKLEQTVRDALDQVIAILRAAEVRPRYDALKAAQFDLAQAVAEDPQRAALVDLIDPERQLGELVTSYDQLLAAAVALREAVALGTLTELYGQVREQLLGLLPPYARKLLDPEAFKRLMSMADPTRFAQALDERFEALRQKLVPISPAEIAGQLDDTWNTVTTAVAQIDLSTSLGEVRQAIDDLKATLDGVRVDFVAADIDRVLGDLRNLVAALDPARVAADLSGVYTDLQSVVGNTLPSRVLATLSAGVDSVTQHVSNLDLRNRLGGPLDQAWEEVDSALHGLDFRVVLSPITDLLDQLEGELEAGLRRTEDAFDGMLAAGEAAL